MRGVLPPSHVFVLWSLSTVIWLWRSGNVGASNVGISGFDRGLDFDYRG